MQELCKVISTHEMAGIQQTEGSEACLPSDLSIQPHKKDTRQSQQFHFHTADVSAQMSLTESDLSIVFIHVCTCFSFHFSLVSNCSDNEFCGVDLTCTKPHTNPVRDSACS